MDHHLPRELSTRSGDIQSGLGLYESASRFPSHENIPDRQLPKRKNPQLLGILIERLSENL